MSVLETSPADTTICLASWEPRFLDGVKKDIESSGSKMCILFFIEEFLEKSRNNIEAIEKSCSDKNVKIVKVELKYRSPLITRNAIAKTISIECSSGRVLIDISTMTREIIWLILDALSATSSCVDYVYWRPEKTAKWTSKNSSRPRLVIGRAGISEYGKPTLVAVTTGFDPSRLDQMVGYFEPEKTILFIQEGQQFENQENNIKQHEGYRLGGLQAVECSIDSYSEDHGFEIISDTLTPFLETHNIVMASFGPKPSAIALHRFAQANPDVALVYTPALDFNRDYSDGIGECVWGELQLPPK